MTAVRFLTHNDRRYRHEKIVAAYRNGATPFEVASQFGLSHTHVCAILRLYGERPMERRA